MRVNAGETFFGKVIIVISFLCLYPVGVVYFFWPYIVGVLVVLAAVFGYRHLIR